MGTNTTSWSGNSRASSRRAGPNLLLRDVRDVTQELTQRRERIFATTAKSLTAAADVSAMQGKSDVAELARKHGVEADALAAWLDYLGIGSGGPVKIESYFTNTIASASGYDFIKGWGSRTRRSSSPIPPTSTCAFPAT